jgi:cathepsin B
MLKLVVIGTIAVAASAYTASMIKDVKAKTNLWTPTELHENQFQGWSKAQMNALLGTIITPNNDLPTYVNDAATPDNFDARTQWAGKIGAIRDQQQCGSCWAFGATEQFADRYAIATGKVLVFSPQEMVSCDTGDYGCQGGYLNVANNFLVSHGVVTDSCTPYVSGGGSAPACTTKCADGSAKTYYKASKVSTAAGVASIKNLIAASGPVETGFTVYEDFFSYSTGVYHHVSGGVAGGHAVKILGWGVESGVNYWLCANSWGPSWGEQGFFKIKQGDCGIDATVYGSIFNAAL